jgi:hypothetical protein
MMYTVITCIWVTVYNTRLRSHFARPRMARAFARGPNFRVVTQGPLISIAQTQKG